MVELIKKIIQKDELDKKCRKVTTVNKRIFLFNALRNRGLTLYQIAEMFKMNHSTIIHGIKRYNEFTAALDVSLKLDTEAYRQILENAPQQKYSLEKDILEAETMQELRTIKRRLYNNLYE